jgi:hypothetical protein
LIVNNLFVFDSITCHVDILFNKEDIMSVSGFLTLSFRQGDRLCIGDRRFTVSATHLLAEDGASVPLGADPAPVASGVSVARDGDAQAGGSRLRFNGPADVIIRRERLGDVA